MRIWYWDGQGAFSHRLMPATALRAVKPKPTQEIDQIAPFDGAKARHQATFARLRRRGFKLIPPMVGKSESL